MQAPTLRSWDSWGDLAEELKHVLPFLLFSHQVERSSRLLPKHKTDFCPVAGARGLSNGLSPSSRTSKLTCSWGKPYSSRLCQSLCDFDVNLFDYLGCKARWLYDDASGERDAHGLSLPWELIIKKPALPTKPCRTKSTLVGKAFQSVAKPHGQQG